MHRFNIPAATFFLRPLAFADAALLLPLPRAGVGGCSLGSRDCERVERVARAGALAGMSCGVPWLWRLDGLADAVDETLAMMMGGLGVSVYVMGCDGLGSRSSSSSPRSGSKLFTRCLVTGSALGPSAKSRERLSLPNLRTTLAWLAACRSSATAAPSNCHAGAGVPCRDAVSSRRINDRQVASYLNALLAP